MNSKIYFLGAIFISFFTHLALAASYFFEPPEIHENKLNSNFTLGSSFETLVKEQIKSKENSNIKKPVSVLQKTYASSEEMLNHNSTNYQEKIFKNEVTVLNPKADFQKEEIISTSIKSSPNISLLNSQTSFVKLNSNELSKTLSLKINTQISKKYSSKDLNLKKSEFHKKFTPKQILKNYVNDLYKFENHSNKAHNKILETSDFSKNNIIKTKSVIIQKTRQQLVLNQNENKKKSIEVLSSTLSNSNIIKSNEETNFAKLNPAFVTNLFKNKHSDNNTKKEIKNILNKKQKLDQSSSKDSKILELSNYWKKVLRKIDRTKAGTVGRSGTVILSIKISEDGNILSVSVEKSSGISRVDNIALKKVKRARFFPPPPSGRAVKATLRVIVKS